MTLRHKLIGHYLPHYEIYDIIPHHGVVYLKTCLLYGGILAFLVLSYRSVTSYVEHPSIGTMRVILGVISYIFFLVDIADNYLDALVITNLGLVHFTRDHLFKQTTITLQWISIETIGEETNSLRDKVFNKGDIALSVEDNEYHFNNIAAPAEQITKVLVRKEKIIGKVHYSENAIVETESDKHVKNEILIEALSEVILEYIDKKKA